MDIIVTTPKSRIADAAAEAADAIAAGGGEYFRRFPLIGHPSVGPGDRVYYVENGYIRGFAVVSQAEATARGRQCQTTGHQWGFGYYVVMAADSWQWIRPMPMVGFQNFRYAWSHFRPEDVVVIGGWLDPKPDAQLTIDNWHSAIPGGSP